MIETTTNKYALIAGDLPFLRTWVNFQNNFGVGRKQLSMADVANYLGALPAVNDAYSCIHSSALKAVIEQLFTLLSAREEVGEMYIVALYHIFCRDNNVLPPPPDAYTYGEWAQPWVSFWDVFAVSSIYEWRTPSNGSNKHGVWESNFRLPSFPASWRGRIYPLYQTWSEHPPAVYIDPGLKIDSHATTAAFEYAVLQKWVDFPSVVATTAPVWQAQRAMVVDMLKEPSLSPDAYLLLLHLIIALTTSNVSDQLFAAKIANAPVNSIEYPNDVLCNQIIYCTLMFFADPLGANAYPHDKLPGLLHDLDGLVTGGDAASVAIKHSISNHLKILAADTSYPMQDPYNPNIGFNTRLSDTLAALDAARSGLV